MRLYFDALGGEQEIIPGDEIEIGVWDSNQIDKRYRVYDIKDSEKFSGNLCLEIEFNGTRRLFHPCYISKIFPKLRRELI